ncbi:MAG TPA: hypothetical protein VGD36_18470 [Xanthobacteraceae bacterium]|jgi:hypothetical protein
MRRILLAAASAATLSLFAGGAHAGTLASGLRGAAAELDGVTPVARVCREVCRGGVCRERCFNRADYDNDGYVERRVYREYSPAPRTYYGGGGYYDPAPGVGIYGPGIGIELGPRW